MDMKNRTTKILIISVILWACWAVLGMAALMNGNRVEDTYPCASLRYDTPIFDAAATAAREYAVVNAEVTAFWPTFWTEKQSIKVEGLNSAESRCLWFFGDADLVWPANFEKGGYPAPLDEAGCAISTTLAWQLWANDDVMGYEVNAQGKTYIVRGVFRESDSLILLGTGENECGIGWQAVALQGVPDGDLRSAALEFAQRSGLGVPDTLVDGPAIVAVVRLFSALPIAVMVVATFVYLFSWLARSFPGKGWVMLFVILFLLALALPMLLEMLPASFIPTRFSDFAFWDRLFTGWGEQIKKWLLLRPFYIDLKVKLLLLSGSALCIAQLIVSVALIRHSFTRK